MKDMEKQNKRMHTGFVYGIAFLIMIIAITISASFTTQRMAKVFNHHPALGEPIAFGFYQPFKFISWYIHYNQPVGVALRPQLDHLFIIFLVSLVLIFFITAFTAGFITKSSRKNKDIHGSAKWAEFEELPKMGLLPYQNKESKGAFVGGYRDKKGQLHYLRHDGPEHIIGIAPTRSGKGVGLVLPTMLTWTSSMLISDMKGELWDATSGWRSKYANNKAIKFDPANPLDSAGFNPLNEIRFGTEFEVSDTQNIVTILVDPEGKGMEDHWSKTSFALLVGVILFALYKFHAEGKGKACLYDVSMLISDPTGSIDDLWLDMINNKFGKDENGNPALHENIAAPAVDIRNTPEEERGSILSTARSFLTLYRDPIVAKNTRKSDFMIDDLMNHDQPVSLYLVVKPSDKKRLKPLVRLMITQILETLIRKDMKADPNGGSAKIEYKHKLLLMLDEFPSFGRLKIFEEALPYIAGYGIKAYLIAQDIEQLRAADAYGREETISANCHVRVAYAPNKLETAEWLSKMTGQKTQYSEDISTSGNRFGAVMGNVNRSIQAFARPLLTPDECLRLKPPVKSEDGLKIEEGGDLIVFVAGNNPVYGEQSLFFTDEVLLARSKVKPLTQTDKIINVHTEKQTETGKKDISGSKSKVEEFTL